MVQLPSASTANDDQGAQCAVHMQTWNDALVQFLQQSLGNQSGENSSTTEIRLLENNLLWLKTRHRSSEPQTFLLLERLWIRALPRWRNKSNTQTWKSKDCCPVSGSLCLVTVRNPKIWMMETGIGTNDTFHTTTPMSLRIYTLHFTIMPLDYLCILDDQFWQTSLLLL